MPASRRTPRIRHAMTLVLAHVLVEPKPARGNRTALPSFRQKRDTMWQGHAQTGRIAQFLALCAETERVQVFIPNAGEINLPSITGSSRPPHRILALGTDLTASNSHRHHFAIAEYHTLPDTIIGEPIQRLLGRQSSLV